jgi:hypothetical protein
MSKLLKIPAKFMTKYFAHKVTSASSEIVRETTYAIAPRTVDTYKEAYNNFDNMFNIFLSKFSDSYRIKKVVKIPFDAKIILFGAPVTELKEKLFVRCALDDQNRLFGIILDTVSLGINMETGDTLNIDNCIYATYFGMIRAAVVTQEKLVKEDEEFNQKMSNYLYLLFLKAIGADQFLSRVKQMMLQIACTFLYYKHYFGMKDSAVYNLITKQYQQLINPDVVKAFYTKYKNALSKFNHIRQIPQFLFDIGLLKTHPNKVLLNIEKRVVVF